MSIMETNLPPLERLDVAEAANVRRITALTLRESPALRSLADTVRADEQLFDVVSGFTARREEFKADYDRPGRNVAPWFAAVARHNPDLLEVALDEHFKDSSEKIKEKLDLDAYTTGYSYWPVTIIGSGPQAQIFTSELLQTRPDLADSVVLIDKADGVGGTFRETDGMNFRLNSRTRKQTDETPTPGTTSNLNTLAPGIMTLPDMVTETYPQADTLGRAVRLNHALNGAPIGLGLELVAVIPDEGEPVADQLPGRVTAVVRDSQGSEFTIRTNALITATGISEPKLGSFNKETQELIKDAHAKVQAGEKTPIMLYTDFYQRMAQEQFPLKDIKQVAVIGDGDSAKTAIGTLLGYEPRPDDSVLQLDSLENVDWYGQSSRTDRQFLENNRLRYGQLALELSRNANRDRANRIESFDFKVSSIDIGEDSKKPLIDGNDYDLVIIATGFEAKGEEWLKDKLRTPLRVSDERVQSVLKGLDASLGTGDTIVFPEGYNLKQLQILHTKPMATYSIYTVAFETADGETIVGQLNQTGRIGGRSELADYCALDNFGVDPAEALTENEKSGVEVLQIKDFLELDEKEQRDFLSKRPIYFPGANGYIYGLLDSTKGYQILEIDDGNIIFGELYFDTIDRKIIPTESRRQISLEQFSDGLLQASDLALFIVNEALVAPSKDTTKISENALSVTDRIEELADQNAIIIFPSDETTLGFVALYRNKDGYIKYGFVGRNSGAWESAIRFDKEKLTYELSKVRSVEVIIPNKTEQKEFVTQDTEVTALDIESFKRLSLKEQLDLLKPGSMYVTGDTSSSKLGAFLITGVKINTIYETDTTFEVVPLLRDPQTGQFFQDAPINSFSRYLTEIIDRVGGRGFITNNPALLKANSGASTIIPTTKDYIIKNLEGLAEQNAVLVDTSSKSAINTMSFVSTPRGLDMSYVLREGPAALQGSYTSLNDWKGILSGAGYTFDTIILPGQSTNYPDLKYPSAQSSRNVVEVLDEDRKPIGKRLEDAPVYLAGPAAGLPVSPNTIRLIPNIPENSVGIFLSQPRVVKLAGKIATGTRPKNNMPDDDPEAGEILNNIGYPYDVYVETSKDALNALSPAVKRLPSETLLRFGLGLASRRNGLSVAGDELRTVSLKVDKDPKYEDLQITVSDKSQLVPEPYFISNLFNQPLVFHALSTMLGKNTRSLRLTLPFDSRGLQIDNIGVELKRKKQARRPVQNR